MKSITVPKKSPINYKYPLNTEKLSSFFAALREVSLGKKATKLEWNNPNIYIIVNDDRLQIKLEGGEFHDLIVSQADMDGQDWAVFS